MPFPPRWSGRLRDPIRRVAKNLELWEKVPGRPSASSLGGSQKRERKRAAIEAPRLTYSAPALRCLRLPPRAYIFPCSSLSAGPATGPRPPMDEDMSPRSVSGFGVRRASEGAGSMVGERWTAAALGFKGARS
ncbi:hypothetical protein DL765_005163 [Monosporascus sp. GIB2]|nr:hypothetical protein DL765_005163 [Monosporascus sp. GIB2]